MFRSLTTRAIIPVTVTVTGFVVVCFFLLYGLMKEDATRDAVHYETNLADTVIKSARYGMLRDDRETMHTLIDNIGSQEGIEHVRIFNKKGLIMFSRDHAEIGRAVDKREAGCIGCHTGPVPATALGRMEQARQFINGRNVPVIAITAPIYNEPACSSAPCHVHPASQKVLGTLDIGLSAIPLKETLATMRSRMIVFSLMVLCLTIGGVAALLRRSVFIPIQKLAEYAAQRVRGEQGGEIPRFNSELDILAEYMKVQEEGRKRSAAKNPATGP